MKNFILVATIALATFSGNSADAKGRDADARSHYKVFVRNVGVVRIQTEYANDRRQELFGLQNCAWEEDGSHSGCVSRTKRSR